MVGEFDVRPPYSTTLVSGLWSNLMPAGNVFLGEDIVVEVFVMAFETVLALVAVEMLATMSLSVLFFGGRGNHPGIVATAHKALQRHCKE
jgi:hypothetical protein